MEDYKQTEGLLTLRGASEYLKISEQTIRSRMKEGLLGYIRDGRRILFTLNQLEEYVETNTRRELEKVNDE